uniref:Tripartite motif containing 16 n=1 Tax=Nothobranchius furzeri TaxID=105023 RepID=A0A8C6K7C7_NOTFU
MASNMFKLDEETISCCICLDLLKEPVTIPCGHSYCMSCITTHWDSASQRKVQSCPQCRKSFPTRPVLVKGTMLAALVEELNDMKLQDAPAAGPEDVSCDVCSGRKRKAVKSCLVCLVSYCEEHLQPHHDAPPLQKHKLVEPSKKLRENICTHHDEAMKIFCRTDQQCICYLCLVNEHKDHETVSAAAERDEKQKEIQEREEDLKNLQQKMEEIDTIFKELIGLMQKRRDDVKKEVNSQKKAEVRRVEEIQETLEQEIMELRRRKEELEQLSLTQDHNEFLNIYPSVSQPGGRVSISSSINSRPPRLFEDVTAAVSDLRDELQDLVKPEPKTRAHFLKYSQEISLDPNLANTNLFLSEGNRKATVMLEEQIYPDHPDRFKWFKQVLSRDVLTGRCYWEVERSGGGYVAVSYKDIRRDGGDTLESVFGFNGKSWALCCDGGRYIFYHNKVKTPVSGPGSSRIGVYLDHGAGILCFCSVSDTTTLLHRVQTTFTQPLHAGFI